MTAQPRHYEGQKVSVVKRKITAVFTAVIFYLVDPKGIEPSNLTDANRALSQLSYGPKLVIFAQKTAKSGFLNIWLPL